MAVRTNSIVIRKNSEGWSTSFRVEAVEGRTATLRSLDSYLISKEDVGDLQVRYQIDTFDPGDTVRIHEDYANRYNEADGENDLTVVRQNANKVPTTAVENNCGTQFNVLNERLYLIKPAKVFLAGDRVVLDKDLVNKYGDEEDASYWDNAGILVVTEDSGSRFVKTTTNVRYEKDETISNNVPTRWLKLYEEPAKRVVGETIKAADVEVGDTIKASFTRAGILNEFTGTVESRFGFLGDIQLTSEGGGTFPYESRGAVFTLLAEAPEPVDENLQRLLDAEVGDIFYGTYANEYWQKIGISGWWMIGGTSTPFRSAEEVFDSLYKLKYGELEIYRKVEDAN